ncbi:MAG: GAF domain-containing protein [Leptolyngbya sp. PLA1]|nr:GAF domain-containing protein [Leptolyngbya sp. PLA1]
MRVQLRDRDNRVIVPREGRGWDFESATTEPVVSVPLRLGEERIGALTLGDGEPSMPDDARDRLEGVLSLLARTAGELVQHESSLRHKVRELAALTRMGSLLVRAAGPEHVLEVTLELALDVLGLDAGSIVLFREDPDGGITELEEDLLLKASRNLSPQWLENPNPLSRDRLFDRMAIAGKMAVSEDIESDERILIRDEALAEGLRAAIHVGLLFNQRALGVIRLYSRRPRSFSDEDRRLLASLAQHAAAACEQSRLAMIEREDQRVQRQLQLAADVQRRMLPRGVPSTPSLDVAARYIPSFELGGDFYDFIELSGHVGVAIGDVVGKGVAAALLMASVRASLRAHTREVYDIDEVVARVNQALCRDTRDNEFASLWYGVIDPVRLRLTYSSAGHEPPLVIRVPKHRPPTPADIDELHAGGMVVGIDPSQRYQRAVFDLKPRDVIVAYTDGVTDTVNFSRERFGKKRCRQAVLAALTQDPEASAASIVERVLWELRQFAGLAPRPDDTTILALRVRE